VIRFYDIQSGELRHAVETESTAIPNLSASGETICLYTSRVECGPPDDLGRVVRGVALPNNSGQNPPVMYWNGQLVVLNTLTGVYVTRP
jgi:hypothetical protein